MHQHSNLIQHVAVIGDLYDQHARMLYKIICCHVKNKAEAELILEKTIKEIYDNLPLTELVAMAGIARRLSRQAGIK